eukprot:sb/3463833/
MHSITKYYSAQATLFIDHVLFPGKRRYNIKLWKTFTDCFNCLPIAAIIDEKIFCCHGGLSPDLQSMEQIRRIMRPTDVPDTEMEKPQEHFTKPSLARIAERCFRGSVMFNPQDHEGGVLRYQTNSMSFYQKMNLRQNSIEGNLKKSKCTRLERERIARLRILIWDYMEVSREMSLLNEYKRSKVRKRKEERMAREEAVIKARTASLIQRQDIGEEGDEVIEQHEEEEEDGQEEEDEVPQPTRRDPPQRLNSMQHTMSMALRVCPELMEELGLAGVEVPTLNGSWSKVSRTMLDLHRTWEKEKNEKKDRAKTARSDPGSRRSEEDKRTRSAKNNHQSYFQSCLAKPFSYEEFADRRISCKENEAIWVSTLRDPNPRRYKRFAVSGEENVLVKQQMKERNIEKARMIRNEMVTLIGTGRDGILAYATGPFIKGLEGIPRWGGKHNQSYLQFQIRYRNRFGIVGKSYSTPPYRELWWFRGGHFFCRRRVSQKTMGQVMVLSEHPEKKQNPEESYYCEKTEEREPWT